MSSMNKVSDGNMKGTIEVEKQPYITTYSYQAQYVQGADMWPIRVDIVDSENAGKYVQEIEWTDGWPPADILSDDELDEVEAEIVKQLL